MISVEKLNERICGDFDAIVLILDELGMPNIHPNYSKREVRCSREEGTNPSSVMVNVDNLYYRCFSTGEKGNIYTLIMNKLDKSFPDALKWVSNILGLEAAELKAVKVKLPFGGYFKKIIKSYAEPELNMKVYDDDILEPYKNKYNILFCKDGIGYNTQRFFGVGYDEYTNRITIPQYDLNGNLVGIMGRLNDSNASKDERWLPIIPCQRSLTLYGYHFNYADISKKQFCLIGESEKFVMQLRSMGLRNSLAVCGCDISLVQARYLKALMCKTLILCFDEGLNEKNIIKQARKIKIDTPLYQNEVGYIYDVDGDILPFGSKAAPSDLGKKALKKLINNKVKWI